MFKRLEELRIEMDNLNIELASVLVSRLELVQKISSVKAALGLPVYAPDREAEILAKVQQSCPSELQEPLVALFTGVLESSRLYAASVSRNDI